MFGAERTFEGVNTMKIGAQFFTIRDFCKTPKDLAESLKKVADIGYTTVQISGTCAYDPEWLDKELRKNGLECVITHIPADRIANEPATVAKQHDVFGCKYVGLGHFGFDLTQESLQKFKDTFLPAAKVLKEHGKYFMYHNHNGEFRRIDGKLILAHLMEEIPAEYMGFTFDTYWAQVGGADPAEWLKRLAGRIPCIHLKDCAYGQQMAVIGEGNINFDRVFQMAEAGGTEYMLVEQDDCNGENPFDCLKRSYDYLTACGFH